MIENEFLLFSQDLAALAQWSNTSQRSHDTNLL